MKRKRSKATAYVTYMAFLVALEVVLNRFCSINTMGLKIGFSFVPIVVAASLFGPVHAAVIYALADFLGAILFPIGIYHPGFTLCAATMGVVYGICLHIPEGEGRGVIRRKRVRVFPNVVAAALINNLVFGLVINTFWVSMLYDSKNYLGWFLYRLPEYAVLIPLNIILIPALLRLCRELKRTMEGKGI
ncbi:MAG: folate family ECF transporter S component [Clostridia bacterium]|nr:folate family ECF transporter S component [Clostridia bacterium]